MLSTGLSWTLKGEKKAKAKQSSVLQAGAGAAISEAVLAACHPLSLLLPCPALGSSPLTPSRESPGSLRSCLMTFKAQQAALLLLLGSPEQGERGREEPSCSRALLGAGTGMALGWATTVPTDPFWEHRDVLVLARGAAPLRIPISALPCPVRVMCDTAKM